MDRYGYLEGRVTEAIARMGGINADGFIGNKFLENVKGMLQVIKEYKKDLERLLDIPFGFTFENGNSGEAGRIFLEIVKGLTDKRLDESIKKGMIQAFHITGMVSLLRQYMEGLDCRASERTEILRLAALANVRIELDMKRMMEPQRQKTGITQKPPGKIIA
ncbi:MAG: hypothetical protein WCT31_01870 [Candidatus Micrarchaeia archaeon]|jgi:hypothetical protein